MNINVFGAEGEIKDIEKFLEKIQGFSDKHNIVIQVFNADMIFGKLHLISAAEHALRAEKNDSMSSNSISMEILLYASGERQLKKAIPKMGIRKGKTKIAFVLLTERENNNLFNILLEKLKLKRNNEFLKGDVSILKKFGFSDLEIQTVIKDKYQDLILEKIAMVDIIK
jgi:KEOPS complex subunit Cgi121